MDSLVGLLDGPRARSAFLLRSVMEPPWSLRIEDEAPLTVASVVAGHAWVIPEDGDPHRLEPGDVAKAVMLLLSMPAGSVVDEVNLSPQKKVIIGKNPA